MNTLHYLMMISMFGFASCCGKATTADEDLHWNVGMASANITPREPIRMAGYASREREQLSKGVASELFAKALVIEDRSGNLALLVTMDVIGLKAHVSDSIYAQIEKQVGIKREQILLNASHTHTGPTIGMDRQMLTSLKDEEHIDGVIAYTKQLSDQIVSLAAKAASGLKPAKLTWGMGVATFVMNRRQFTERGVRLGVNPRGLADRSVPVIKIVSPDNKLLGIVFGAACHNTTLGGRDMLLSGDYAGYSQRMLQRQLDGVQAMFVQGCAGDANPFPRGGEALARLHGKSLSDEVMRVIDGPQTPLQGPLKTLLKPVRLPLQTQITQGLFDQLERSGGATQGVAKKLRDTLSSGGKLPDQHETSIALWQFGDDLTLVGLPAEVVVDYVRLIEDEIGPEKLWVSAYNHDVFGYLPSLRVLREGGYETRGIYSGGFGIFAPQTEDVIVQTVAELARAAGRKEIGLSASR